MISVIMPVYNTDKNFISDAVYSVLSQTRKDFELIIVDDGSNEETKQALQELFFQGGISKIVHHTKNKGIAAARNSGVNLAKGEYISFLSSDDVWKNNFLEIMMKNFTEGIIFSDYDNLSSAGGLVKTPNSFPFTKPHTFDKETFKSKVLELAKNHTIPVNYSCLIGEKQYFIGENSFWEGARFGEDMYHLIKMCSKLKFTYVPESLVCYRSHKNTTTQKEHHNIHENNENIFKKLNKEGINTPWRP